MANPKITQIEVDGVLYDISMPLGQHVAYDETAAPSQKAVAKSIAKIASALGAYVTGVSDIELDGLVNKSVSSTTGQVGTANTTRITTEGVIVRIADTVLRVAKSSGYSVAIYWFDENGDFLKGVGAPGSLSTVTPPDGAYAFRPYIYKTDNSDITAGEVSANVLMQFVASDSMVAIRGAIPPPTEIVQSTGSSETAAMSQKAVSDVFSSGLDFSNTRKLIYTLDYTNKAINASTGEQSAVSNIRASTPGLYYVPKGCRYTRVANTGYTSDAYVFDKDGKFLGGNVQSLDGYYVRILALKSDSTATITPEEARENVRLEILGESQIDTLAEDVANLEKYFVNDNLLKGVEYKEGYYWNSAFTESPYYNVFYLIPVKSGVKYIIEPKARMILSKANADGSGAIVDRLTSGNYTEYTPSADGYVYLTMYSDDNVTDYAFYEEGKTNIFPYNKVALSDEVMLPELPEVTDATTDILYNKKWAPLGDSFTHGSRSAVFTEGKYVGKQKTYPYFIGNRTGINILSQFFAGGRTLAYPSDGTFTNSVTCPTAACYYQNIPEDTDYVTIYLGINDSHHESGTSGSDGEDVTGVIPLGTIDDDDTSTYYGAWNVVLTWLRENRPFTHVGMLVSNGCDRAAYRTAQLEIAKKHGVPFIDMNGDDRTPVMIRSMNTDIASAVRNIVTRKQAVDYDGTITGSVNLHPNDEAHGFESTFIENFLRTL